ncbi:hypothetical protein JFU37_21145 [Pseudomonas sp. TH41]|uniref:hypothetical protein n=1 Tax=Pseudomonas sp. TH41 TaxID=2796405 RepID=UPI0019122926|nr:hypothetical protein [Pseudomonas sp. TH41]MBK5354991.1 hypothetical protein [Pseudomonas sp. TH41]
MANAQRKISPTPNYRPAWPTQPDVDVGLFIACFPDEYDAAFIACLPDICGFVGAAEGCDLLILL